MTYPQAISYSRAIDIVTQKTQEYFQASIEKVNVVDAGSRVLAEKITANINVPAFRNSAMDGFAIRYADLPEKQGWLKLQAAQFAGDTSSESLKEGYAVPVTTGAMVPEAADTIVIKEHSETKEGSVYLRDIGDKGAYIRDVGSDIRQNSTILDRHHRLKAQDLGLLSSVGVEFVNVYPKVKVVLFTGGDEVIKPGTKLLPGQVYDSTQPTLLDLLQSLGCEVVHCSQLKDDEALIEKALQNHENENTLILTTGAVSAGEKDHILHLMQKKGEMFFHKTNIKPGFPLLFGKFQRSLFIGLPGNPVSSFVTFCQFVVPMLKILEGEKLIPTPLLRAQMTRSYSKTHYRREFVRARLSYDVTAGFEVCVSGHQSSGRLSSVTDSNCFIVFDETPEEFKVGDKVSVQRFVDLLYPHLV